MSILSELSRLTNLRNNIRTKLIALGILSDTNASLSDCYTGINGIAKKSSSDLTASGATVSVPSGYYASNASKSVSTTSHPNPTATINTSTGVVTASHTQTAGYVSAGTTTGTLSLSTQAATTITPSTSAQTAVAAGKYTTGAVTVAAIQTETKNMTLGASAPSSVTPTSGKYLTNVAPSIDTSVIKAENIKSGVQMLGITGTHQGGSSPTLQSKSVTYTSNGSATVTPDSGYDGLSQVDVTVNVSGGGGGSVTFTIWNQIAESSGLPSGNLIILDANTYQEYGIIPNNDADEVTIPDGAEVYMWYDQRG